jgi:hypothetical protein
LGTQGEADERLPDGNGRCECCGGAMKKFYVDVLYGIKRTKAVVKRKVKLCDLCHERLTFLSVMDEVYQQ